MLEEAGFIAAKSSTAACVAAACLESGKFRKFIEDMCWDY